MRAASLERRDEVGIFRSVFLDGDGLSSQRSVRIDRHQQLPPGVGLGDLDRRPNAELAERRPRLGTAGDGDDRAQGGNQALARHGRRGELHEEARADAGQEDGDVDFAGGQAPRELAGGRVPAERHLAHRRRADWLPAMSADELRDLDRTPALEADDAQAGKSELAQMTSFSFSLATSSHEYPSSAVRISSVCWPNSGAVARTDPGVAVSSNGMPIIWMVPKVGCSTSTT